jgi:hypothetical protein
VRGGCGERVCPATLAVSPAQSRARLFSIGQRERPCIPWLQPKGFLAAVSVTPTRLPRSTYPRPRAWVGSLGPSGWRPPVPPVHLERVRSGFTVRLGDGPQCGRHRPSAAARAAGCWPQYREHAGTACSRRGPLADLHRSWPSARTPSSSRGHRAGRSLCGWPESCSPWPEPWKVSLLLHCDAPAARFSAPCVLDCGQCRFSPR